MMAQIFNKIIQIAITFSGLRFAVNKNSRQPYPDNRIPTTAPRFIKALVIGLVLLCFVNVSVAQAQAEKKKGKSLEVESEAVTTKAVKISKELGKDVTVKLKEVMGEISMITPMDIIITYARDEAKKTEYDMIFPKDPDLKIINKKSLDEIALGDLVAISYEVRLWTNEEGKDRLKRKVKSVRFIRPAIKGLRSK